jgi:hypothetical protein
VFGRALTLSFAVPPHALSFHCLFVFLRKVKHADGGEECGKGTTQLGTLVRIIGTWEATYQY